MFASGETTSADVHVYFITHLSWLSRARFTPEPRAAAMGGAASAPEDPGAAVPSADGAATEVASQTGRTDRVPPADAKAVAAGAADRRSFDAGDAYVTGATPYTERDEAWLRSGPLSKALDPNLRVVRVASRCPRNGTPRVLECYPLRRTLSVARSETKGFSKHK